LKSPLFSAYIIAFFAIFLFNCKKENTTDAPEPEINNHCKISEIGYESRETDNTGTLITRSKESLKNGYDEKQNLIFSDHMTENWQNEILVRKRLYQTSNQFDAQNFVTNSLIKIEDNSLYNNQMSTAYAGSAGTYQYENQRLVLSTIKTLVGKNNDTIATSTEKFEYTPQGQLTKKIISSSNNEITSTFLNGILISQNESNPSNVQTEVTYNDMGFQILVKSIYNNSLTENRNVYDHAGNMIQTSFYSAGNLITKVIYTYGHINLQNKAQPQFQGHPKIASFVGSNANLLSKTETFTRIGFGQEMVKTAETHAEYTFNPSGYFTSLKSTRTSYNTDGSEYKSSEALQTITYTHCQ
jgi:hypothetical protein